MKLISPVVLLLSTALAGCYSFQAVPVQEITPGSPVRARLSASEAERQAAVLGVERRVLHGTVVGAGGGDVVLQVRSVHDGASALHQRLTVSRGGLLEIELRRFDPVRTAGLVAVIAAGAAYAAVTISGGVRGRPGSDVTEPNAVLIPLFRLR